LTPQLDMIRWRVLPSTSQSASTRPDRSNSSLASRSVSANKANADSVNDLPRTKPIFNRSRGDGASGFFMLASIPFYMKTKTASFDRCSSRSIRQPSYLI